MPFEKNWFAAQQSEPIIPPAMGFVKRGQGQSNPSFLKAFCKLTLTPGITERSKAVRFAKRHAMRAARVRDLGTSIGLGLGKASRSNGACRSSRSRRGMQAQR